MDERGFDALVQRIAQLRLARRAAVRGVAASALASAITLPRAGESAATTDRGHPTVRSTGKGKHHKRKAQAAGHGQVRAASCKKPFCLCRGTSPAQCTPTTCVDCTYQGELGKRARKRIKKTFPFSFVVDDASACPGPTTTAAPTTTTTTTPAVCGGTCRVDTTTCAAFGDTCVCRGASVEPGSPGSCTTRSGICHGQVCRSGAFDTCAGLGAGCVCVSSGPPGSLGTCGRGTTTPPPLTTRVVVTVDPLVDGFCGVTLTLVDGVSGRPVSVFVDISNGAQFRPVFEPPTRIQDTGLLAEGQALVSARAEQLDGDYQPTGVSVPVEFPTTPCGG